MESSRRDLLNNMAEHRFILKKNQNMTLVLFPDPKQELLKTGVVGFFVIKPMETFYLIPSYQADAPV